MAINWNYNPADYNPEDYAPLAAGDYRVRIDEVIPKTSKSGNEMFELTLAVSGKNSKLWYYIVLMPDNRERTNQNLGKFFEAFRITNFDLNQYHTWLGKIGGVRVKHEEYNGEISAKVQYLLKPEKTDKLPPWVEPSNGMHPAQDSFQQVDSDTPW